MISSIWRFIGTSSTPSTGTRPDITSRVWSYSSSAMLSLSFSMGDAGDAPSERIDHAVGDERAVENADLLAKAQVTVLDHEHIVVLAGVEYPCELVLQRLEREV